VRAALDQFERVHSRYVESPEGWAALLEIGSIYAQRRDDERALQAFIDATRLYAHLDSDSNPWISNEELRDRLVKAYGLFLDHGAFSYAIALAEAISPPVTVEDSWELAAKAYQAWGRKLIADASGLGAADAAAQKRQGRARLRSAAKLFNQLAEKRFATRFYPSDRWNCATCYMEGQNYTAAVYYLDEYLARAPRRDRPSGLLALGRALLALGEYEQSVQVLRECIEFHPKHPAQFEARIVRGAAFLELGELDQAAESLRGNLEGDLLTPSSKEWRESLFALARLYHAAGRYDEALARLNEAIERYPDDHQVLEARYLVADSLFQLAARYGKQMENELVEETRRHLSVLRRKSYEQAVVRYEQFLEQLRDRESASELTAAQRAMQRASRLNHAAALVALERYPQAVEALGSVLARYPNAPECIAAYVQLAECHRRLGNPEEVKTALALGKVALDRIGDTLPWIERTGLSRDRWASYLTWLQTL
jgi:tetratricopeptide (TPR) repeat protein